MTNNLSSSNKRCLRDQQQRCIPQVLRETPIVKTWITSMLLKGPGEGSAVHVVFLIIKGVYLHKEVVQLLHEIGHFVGDGDGLQDLTNKC